MRSPTAHGDPADSEPAPLALFTAERVDYSLQRLAHYTGTHPEYFQRFVLLTNYQRYVEHFCRLCAGSIETGTEYDRFVWPGDAIVDNRRLRDETDGGTAAGQPAADAGLPPDATRWARRHA